MLADEQLPAPSRPNGSPAPRPGGRKESVLLLSAPHQAAEPQATNYPRNAGERDAWSIAAVVAAASDTLAANPRSGHGPEVSFRRAADKKG